MTTQHIEAELREDAWNFGFYLGNSTLLAFYHDADIFDEDYDEFLWQNRHVFAATFAVVSNNCLSPHDSGQSALTRAATWVAQTMLPTVACDNPIECLLRWIDRSVVLEPPIAPWEINC